jgi:hypothetical protein
MKKKFTKSNSTVSILKLLAICLIIVFSSNIAVAQRIVNVPDFSDLTDVIHGDTTATGNRVDDNTIYVLERNGIYEVTKPLSLNVKLHLRGDDGEGDLPAIFPKVSEAGDWPQVIMTRGDLTLENVYISNQNGNVNKWGGVRALGNNTRVEIRNCHFEWERAAAILLNADSITCIIEDSRVSKMGNRNVYQGNGRLVDTRGKYVDTLIVRNTTFYYLSDRIIRNMGGHINYFEFDHNTGIHVQGRHGAFQLAKVNTAKITNNLVINPLYGGSHPGTEEQTQPDKENFYIITLDTLLADQEIEIRNNNFAFEPEVVAFWETLDTVSKPAVLEPLVIQAIGQDAVASAYIEELVTFASVPTVPMDFLEGIYQNPAADVQPENQDLDDVGIESIDASYSSDYDSYTAADRGFPLGDLNHFPELKALWLSGGTVSSHNILKADKISVKAYPNPVEYQTTFAFELSKPMNVQLSIYNVQGRKVADVFNGVADQGLNTVNWSTSSSASIEPGVYFYKLTTGETVQTNSIIITR